MNCRERTRSFSAFALGFAFLFCLSSLVFAQESLSSLTGTLNLQGRSDHSGVTLTLLDALTLQPKATTTSNASGAYSFLNIPSGNYVLTAEKALYLPFKKVNIVLSPGDSITLDLVELRGGDANNDKKIDVKDLKRVQAAFDSKTGDAKFNASADLNGDGKINVADFSILSSNYPTIPDTKAPQILLFGPEGTTNDPYPLITVIVSDSRMAQTEGSPGIALQSATLTLDGNTVTLSHNEFPQFVVFSHLPKSPLSSGEHTLSFSVFDDEGNKAEKSWTFTSAFTQDAVYSSLTPGNFAYVKTLPSQFSATANVPLDASQTLVLFLDETALTTNYNAATKTVSAPAPAALSEGVHSLSIVAKTTSGVTANFAWSFFVDTTGPEVVLLSPDTSAKSFLATPLISFKAYDGTPGALSTTGAGLDEKSVVLKVDGAAVTVTKNVSGHAFSGTPANITFSYQTTTPLSPGNHEIIISAKDTLGNTTQKTFTFEVSSIAFANELPKTNSFVKVRQPTILLSTVGDIDAGTLLMKLDNFLVPAGYDAEAKQIKYAVLEKLGDGAHTVFVSVKDTAGNSATFTWQFFVDTTAPKVKLKVPFDGSLTNESTPLLQADVADDAPEGVTLDASKRSGVSVSTVNMSLDGNDVASRVLCSSLVSCAVFGAVSTPLTEAEHKVNVTLQDNAGNFKEDFWSFTYTTVQDTTPPVISDILPSDGTASPGSPKNISAKILDNQGGVGVLPSSVRMALNNKVVPVTYDKKTGKINFIVADALSDSRYQIYITASDKFGNRAEAASIFYVDATPPVIKNLIPIPDAIIQEQPFTVSATIEDDKLKGSGIDTATVVLKIDDVVFAPTVTTTKSFQVTGFEDTIASLSTTATLSEGYHTLTLVVKDKAGNSSAIATARFLVDTKGPIITDLFPAPDTVWKQNPGSVRAKIYDDGIGLDEQSIALNIFSQNWTVSYNAVTQLMEYTPTPIFDPETPHNIVISAKDKLGHLSEVNYIIIRDGTPPKVESFSPANAGFLNQKPTITVTLSDNNIGVDPTTVKLTLDANPVSFHQNGSLFFTDVLNLTEGLHTLIVEASDSAQNAMTPFTWSFFYDVTKPVVSNLTPQHDARLKASPLEISFSVTDGSGSGIDQVAAVYTTQGGVATPLSFIYDVVTGKAAFSPPLPLPDEFYRMGVDVIDKAGNSTRLGEMPGRFFQQADSWNFAVDTTPPIIILRSPDANDVETSNRGVSVGLQNEGFVFGPKYDQAELFIDGSKVATSFDWSSYCQCNIVRFFNPQNALSEGKHTAFFSVEDFTGNKTESTWDFFVDFTPAVISDVTPVNGSVFKQPPAEWTAVISDLPFELSSSQIHFSVNGADAPFDYDPATKKLTHAFSSPLPDGRYDLVISVTDKGGHQTATTTTVFVDNVAPTVERLSPPDGAFLGTASPHITVVFAGEAPGTASDFNRTDVFMSLDGTPVTPRIDPFGKSSGVMQISLLPTLSDGLHTVVVKVKDNAGNEKTAAWSFTVDATLPKISGLFPADRQFLNASPPALSVKVEDADLEVSAFELFLCAVTPDCPAQVPAVYDAVAQTFTYTLPAPLLEGVYFLRLRAKDLSGNEVVERTRFTVDMTHPVLESPPTGQTVRLYFGYPTSVGVNVSDALSGVDLSSVSFSLDGEAVHHEFSFWPPGKITVGIRRVLSEGTHTAEVKVKDAAGNETIKSWSFQLDGTAPVIENVTPVQGSIVTAPSVGFSAKVTDVPSGVAALNFRLDGGALLPLSYNPDTKMFTAPFPEVSDGTHSARLDAWDKAGILSTATWAFVLDTHAPVVTRFVPKDVSKTANGMLPIVISFTENLTGLDGTRTQLTDNGVPLDVKFSLGGGTISYVPPVPWTEGAHALALSLYDTAGNVFSTTHTFTYDPAFPPFTVEAQTPSRQMLSAQQGQTTTFRYTLPEDAYVTLKLMFPNTTEAGAFTFFTRQFQTAGEHQILWDGKYPGGSLVPDGYYVFWVTAENTETGEVSSNDVFKDSQFPIYPERICRYTDFGESNCRYPGSQAFYFPPAFSLRNESSSATLTLNEPSRVYLHLGISGGPPVFVGWTGPFDKGENVLPFHGRLGLNELSPIYHFAIFSGQGIGDYYVVTTGNAPRATNVTVTPLVFNAKNNESASISFTLSEAITGTVQVFDEARKLIKNLASNASFAEGVNSVSWDGKDAAGQVVADDVYAVLITGQDAQGYNVQDDWLPVSPSARVWVNTPSIKAVFQDAASGFMNPHDPVTVLDNGTSMLVDQDVENGIYKATLPATPGNHTITLQTSRGYSTSQEAYYVEFKNVTAQNFNPYNGETTTIQYELTAPETVFVGIVDGAPEEITTSSTLVKLLVSGELQAEGSYSVSWDGKDESGTLVPEGTYTYVLFGITETRKYAVIPPSATGAVQVFKGAVITDSSASVISFDSVTITWKTDVESDSQIEYGETTSYGTKSILDATQVKNHSITLTGLKAGVTYHFRVLSKNATGKLSTSKDFTFTIPKLLSYEKKYGGYSYALMFFEGLAESAKEKEYFSLAKTPQNCNVNTAIKPPPESTGVDSNGNFSVGQSPDFISNPQNQSCCGCCWSCSYGCPPACELRRIIEGVEVVQPLPRCCCEWPGCPRGSGYFVGFSFKDCPPGWQGVRLTSTNEFNPQYGRASVPLVECRQDDPCKPCEGPSRAVCMEQEREKCQVEFQNCALAVQEKYGVLCQVSCAGLCAYLARTKGTDPVSCYEGCSQKCEVIPLTCYPKYWKCSAGAWLKCRSLPCP